VAAAVAAGAGRTGEIPLSIVSHPDWVSLATVRIPHLKRALYYESLKKKSARETKVYRTRK
jgi:hypothetical protein